jgi:pimeloyl-ACP methyl ester carboxylesterase
MHRSTWKSVWTAFIVLTGTVNGQSTQSVEVPIGPAGEVSVSEVIARVARASGTQFEQPAADLTLSTQGLARGLTKTLLSESLGSEVAISFRPGAMVLTIDPRILAAERREEWVGRLRGLAERAAEAARRRQIYGMRGLESYRPNDPARPTICLVHGLNSSSGGFVHMIPWLQEAGYGIVVYDFPFNRSLEESCTAFARDWAAFRRQVQDKLPWAIVAHSMGALLARSLIEDDTTWGRDVSSLVTIAPVNQGSHLARVQTLVQIANGLHALNGKNTTNVMMSLADGLGAAAEDLLPGSAFLKRLNGRPRRPGVPYHIIAGDRGFLTRQARAQLEAQIDFVNRGAGIFGRVTQLATADLPALLDEVSDGTGDGCVALTATRLEGVSDSVTIHANHAELIRAPLLFADPGPVVCMPDILRCLKADVARPGKPPAP